MASRVAAGVTRAGCPGGGQDPDLGLDVFGRAALRWGPVPARLEFAQGTRLLPGDGMTTVSNSAYSGLLFVYGAASKVRTHDILITSQALYQLSYDGEVSFVMVPESGLEPERLAAPPPQDGVSTSSTTRASLFAKNINRIMTMRKPHPVIQAGSLLGSRR
jgi:hypothetical protein